MKCLRALLPPPRQEALLAAISEKDANIALLELSSSKKKKTQDEVALLKREKDRLVQQLKQQVGLLSQFLNDCFFFGSGAVREVRHEVLVWFSAEVVLLLLFKSKTTLNSLVCKCGGLCFRLCSGEFCISLKNQFQDCKESICNMIYFVLL